MIYEQFENESDTSVSKDDDSDWIKVLTNRGCLCLFASVNSEPYEISCIVAVYGWQLIKIFQKKTAKVETNTLKFEQGIHTLNRSHCNSRLWLNGIKFTV